MQSTDLLLVRHGSFDGMLDGLAGRQPVPLNAEGRRQALELAQLCAGLAVTRVVSSPQVRAVQTAADIARECRTSVELAPGFDEVDFGEWTGRTFVELALDHAWLRFNRERDQTAIIPGGEAMAAVQQRALRTLGRLIAATSGECTVIVTHAEIIRAVLLDARGQDWSEWGALSIGPGTLTWVRYESPRPAIQAIGVEPQLWASDLGELPPSVPS